MLDFLPKFAELLLSSCAVLMLQITEAMPVGAGNARLAPQDPSTLALGFVGLVTLALYFAATGWRRPRREVTPTLRRRLETSGRHQSMDGDEVPKRGAA
jgi:hypothetical protein